MSAPPPADNAVRYAGGPHVESYFLKAVSPDAARALWLKATIFATADRAFAEGWAVAFDHRSGHRHVAVKHSLPYAQARFSGDRLAIRWRQDEQHFELEEGRTTGHIACRGHALSWDLQFVGEPRPLHLVPPRLYRSAWPRSKTVTPLPDGRFSGELSVDGERWLLDGWRGMQGHNWGSGHAEAHAWLHCNQWEGGEQLVVEALSVRLSLAGMRTPVLTTVALRLDGEDRLLSRWSDVLRARGSIGSRGYDFRARIGALSIAGRVEAELSDFVGLYYPNPDGPMTYCLNAKLARADLVVREGGSARRLRSNAAALEIGTRRADHGVSMHV